ncbi:MAG: hypothetical protein FWD76_05620 [Firmicutes bacterium]|nr:hypothetical protein [Bacillota bacterium]
MKKLIIAILIVLAGFLGGGCATLALPKPLMIEKMEICNLCGVDFEAGKYTLCLGLKKVGSSGSEDKKAVASIEVATATHSNLGDALGQVVASRSLSVYLGDVETIIFGSTLLEQGIDKALDFFLRSEKVNQFAKIYAVQGKASETIQKISEQPDSDNIQKKSEMDLESGYTTSLTMIDSIKLLAPQSSGVVPMILMQTDQEGKEPKDTSGGESASGSGDTQPKTNFVLQGLAIVKDKKQVGVLDKQGARGYNALKNSIHDGTMGIEFEDYQVGVDNLSVQSKTKVDIENGKFVTQVSSKQSGNLSFVTDSAVQRLGVLGVETQVEQKIGADIQQDILVCLHQVASTKADFVGLLDKYKVCHKESYQKITAEQKEQLLSQMECKVQSNADIKRAHQVRE